MLRRQILTALMVSVVFASPVLAQSTAWPQRLVKIIVPAPAGSGPDVIGRTYAQRMSEMWNQPVLVENVVGAAGNIGTDRAAKAAADGYTLLFNTQAPIAVNPILERGKLPYDPLKDLVPISLAVKLPNLLVVHPSVPAKTMAELVVLAKKDPKRLRYGTPGTGTSSHFSGELLKLLANIDMTSVPYKSSAQMTTDGISGQFELMFHTTSVVLPFVKDGRLRALGVTSAKRLAMIPDIPSIGETVPGYEMTAWYGFMAPTGTPPAVINQVYQAVTRIHAIPAMRTFLESHASEPVGSTPEEYSKFIAAEMARWGEVIVKANIKAD